MAIWLIEKDAAIELQRRTSAPLAITAAMIEAYFDRPEPAEGPRCLRIAGNEAVIKVAGVLTKTRDAYYYYYDIAATTYTDIGKALTLAEQNPDVKRIVLEIDSPGGQVDGLFEAMEAVRTSSKKTLARCSRAASAAYGLASSCKSIEALSAASMFGSIGVATTYYFWNGETVVDLTNTDSPDKRPDVRTEEGKAVVRKELDAIAELFYEAIAAGRGVKADVVREAYGRGAMFVAADAKRAGMIEVAPKLVKAGARASDEDEPQPSAAAAQPEPTAQRGEENVTMDLNAFKAAHPALFESIVKTAGDAAVAAERDRVGAHVAMGESSGDMKTALKAIADGAPMTQTLLAQYMAAGMRKSAVGARQTESTEVEAAVAGGTPDASNGEGPDVGDAIVALHQKKNPQKKAG
jgi:ClpP class serine protease